MGGKNKYNTKKAAVDGHTLDSKRGAEGYCGLKFSLRAKEIQNLQLQPRSLLQDGFVDKGGNGHKKIEYVADFMYVDGSGKTVIEDVKGVLTDVYKIKKKIFLKIYDDKYYFKEIRWRKRKLIDALIFGLVSYYQIT